MVFFLLVCHKFLRLYLTLILNHTVNIIFFLNFQGGRPPYFYLFNHYLIYSLLPEWTGVIHGTDISFVSGAPFKNIPDLLANLITRKYSETEKGVKFVCYEVVDKLCQIWVSKRFYYSTITSFYHITTRERANMREYCTVVRILDCSIPV